MALCEEDMYMGALQCAALQVAKHCLKSDYDKRKAEADSKRKDTWLHRVRDPIGRVLLMGIDQRTTSSDSTWQRGGILVRA